MKVRTLLAATLVVGGIGCGESTGPSEVEWAWSSSDIAPASHGVVLVDDTFPTTMNPGEKRNVRFTLENSGTASPNDDWIRPSYRFYSRNGPLLEWDWASTPVPADTAVGATTDIFFTIQAPAANPTEDFEAQMLATNRMDGQNGFFGPRITKAINVDAATQRAWDCTLVDSSGVPATMNPGDVQPISITVQNSGTGTWTAGDFCLYDRDLDWGANVCPDNDVEVAPGANHTFNFVITAPADGNGATPFRRQLFGTAGPTQPGGIGFFDEINNCVDLSVNVGGATEPWASALVTEDFPRTMSVGESRVVTVTMRNEGTEVWDSDVKLYSRNTPLVLWDRVTTSVEGSVTTNQTFSFSFRIEAPATPGEYRHRWRLIGFNKTPPAGFFGELIDIPVTVGTDAATVVDTASDPADRLFQSLSLDSVSSGDFDGDGTDDVVLGHRNGLDATGAAERSLAGTVFGYTGAAGFFGTALTMAPAGAAFQIVGADTFDLLGSGSDSGIKVGNVSGGTAPQDLVVSAIDADGVGNARSECGEIFVFDGAQLSGFVDLSTTTPSLTARIIGPEAGGKARVLDVADVNGDGLDDIMIGVPFASPAGRTEAGEVYILAGGAGLTGTIDLSTVTAPLLIAQFQGDQGAAGVNPGDKLGSTGAFGNVAGTADVDVLLGAPAHSGVALRAGAVYLVEGPLAGAYDLAMDYDSRWRSQDRTAALGTKVLAADVRGTAALDVIISGTQLLSTAVGEPASQRGGVLVLEGPIASADAFLDKTTGYVGVDSAIFGEEFGDQFGSSLDTGDFDNDGVDDLLIGASTADGPTNARTSAGVVQVLLGGADLTAVVDFSAGNPADYIVHGPRQAGLLGRGALALTMADLDGDGAADFCAAVTNGGNEVYCFESPN